MGEVALVESALAKPGRGGQVGLLNLDKYRKSNLPINKQIESEESAKSPEEGALSPEYKSLWSEVQIQVTS